MTAQHSILTKQASSTDFAHLNDKTAEARRAAIDAIKAEVKREQAAQPGNQLDRLSALGY